MQESTDSLLSDSGKKAKVLSKENPLISAVQLIGDGVSRVHSIGNQAVNNLVSFLNISPEDLDINQPSAENMVHDEMESQKTKRMSFDRSSSLQSDTSSDATSLQIGRIFRHICLLSMVFLAALFLYALCVNTGPSYIFWVIMLMYTESSITVKDGEWIPSTDIKFRRSSLHRKRFWSRVSSIFVQVSMDVPLWPEDGIQPERIESGINQLLKMVHDERCKEKNPNLCPFLVGFMSKALKEVRESNVALVVLRWNMPPL
ncbi:hypothetical protein POTOM_061237 [Populus tomentosa]|uniref:Piezo transmembrane helical unit domain-containing protein n=1 Tax=Populus tomentosa TaxID=118781 RepID=A0A8X7XSU9_POPTO|nr:hypothetical protein POTOM_061237 [Populus tomentosa]